MTTARAPRPFTGPPLSSGKFTGRHAAVLIVAFFAVVIAVNVTMARLASSTFGGTVVDNSYVASQRFNAWLDQSAADKALGWKAETGRGADGALEVRLVDNAGAPIAGARVIVHAEHPLGARPPVDARLIEATPGLYRAALPAGRWHLWLTAAARGHEWRTVGEVR